MKLSDQNLQINCNFRSNKYRALVKSSILCLAQDRLLQIMIKKNVWRFMLFKSIENEDWI